MKQSIKKVESTYNADQDTYSITEHSIGSKTISVRLNLKEHSDYLTKCKANGWTISRKLKDAILDIVNSTN
jgi:hypothetical protein